MHYIVDDVGACIYMLVNFYMKYLCVKFLHCFCFNMQIVLNMLREKYIKSLVVLNVFLVKYLNIKGIKSRTSLIILFVNVYLAMI